MDQSSLISRKYREKGIKDSPNRSLKTISFTSETLMEEEIEKIDPKILESNKQKFLNFTQKIRDTGKNVNVLVNDLKKSGIQLPLDLLPEIKEIIIIYNRIYTKVSTRFQIKKNWTHHDNVILVWLILGYCVFSEKSPEILGDKELDEILSIIPGKTIEQAKFKWFSFRKTNLYSSPWTQEEDEILKNLIMEKGSNHWNEISKELNSRQNFNQFRLGKQCRERWNNHLDPSLNRGPWTENEDLNLLKLVVEMGKKWSEIAKKINGRTENAVKNRFISLMNKEKSTIVYKQESEQSDSSENEFPDDNEEITLIKQLVSVMENGKKEKSISKSYDKRKYSKINQTKNIKLKKNMLLEIMINEEQKIKIEEKGQTNNQISSEFQIFNPDLTLPISNMDSNQSPILMFLQGIKMVRKSLYLLQKSNSKRFSPEISQLKNKEMLIKDFNTLLSENSFQNLQLGLYNSSKNEMFIVQPMTDKESDFSFEGFNKTMLVPPLMTPNHIPNLSYSSFPIQPSMGMVSPNFTPIMNQSFRNNNLFYGSNFSSPAINFGLMREFENAIFQQNLLDGFGASNNLNLKMENDGRK